MITYHPWYHQFRPSIANKCLAETAELGAGYSRIDIRWKDLIPDGQNVDEAAWAWYEGYLRAAHDWYGLRPLIVLSNAPEVVLRYSVDSRLAAWNRYVDEVALRVGRLCNIYQLFNEPNNPVYRIFPTKTTPAAILTASEVIRRHNAEAQIVINILAGLWGWQSNLEEILQESGSAIDIVGFDYYPGTWTVSSGSDTSNWNRLVDLIAKSGETGASTLQNGRVAIIETGYATNLQRWRGEQEQVKYFKSLESAIKHLDTLVGRDRVALVGIHELTDNDTNTFLDPEAHFGLLTSGTLDRKAAFDVVRQIFGSV
jgi:beta-glucosidase/6-phospho-beta-glucosidase/beta-galactosidase